TGKFRAVDNVPAGLAVAASVLSTVGYATTEKMEQAFSVPSMTEYGSLDPLFTLATLYDTLKTPMRWTGQTGAYGDLDASVSNYVKNCVGNDIIRGSKTFASMYRSNQGVSGL
ncbi:conjugal transfer protein TraG N-terminal domain-containing protein, partial [Citrobacter freundii]